MTCAHAQIFFFFFVITLLQCVTRENDWQAVRIRANHWGKNTQVRKKNLKRNHTEQHCRLQKKDLATSISSSRFIAWKMKRKSELDGSLICPKTQSDPLYFPYVNTARSSFSPPKFNMTNYNPAPATWWIYMARLYIWIGYSYKADNKFLYT
jgi:hypothetical protein